MNYAPLIEQALVTMREPFSLADLLSRVDAINKSVPSLEELNAAFVQIRESGRWRTLDWGTVSRQAYEQALSLNWERVAQLMESQGISRDRQQEILREHARKWGRHET